MSSYLDRKRSRNDAGDNNPIAIQLKRPKSALDDGTGAREQGDHAPRSSKDYTIGWICALYIEMAAAQAMLESIHDNLPTNSNDRNTYVFGNIGSHNIVIACLPADGYGTNKAAIVANDMHRSFPSIRSYLMVGIGGGAPGKSDIRLGDVVVGNKVVQYDLGKTLPSGFQRKDVTHKPPKELMTAVNVLRANQELTSSKIPLILSEMLKRYPSMNEYGYHNSFQDWLFTNDYDHLESALNCEDCCKDKLVKRLDRQSRDPKVHIGAIASGNRVIKHGMTRDRLAEELDVLCFEMEAAGLMESFSCLVVRGICDYSDSHKNKQWQKYAAATAAAYTKELLSILPMSSGSSVAVNWPSVSGRCCSSAEAVTIYLLLQTKNRP